MKRHTPTFEEYVKANRVTECAGFWYCGPGASWSWDARDYRGVLLASCALKSASLATNLRDGWGHYAKALASHPSRRDSDRSA